LYYVSSMNEEERLVLRSTGEPAMYPIFNLWIKQGKLPIRVYETVSSFRNEGRTTHTMIRDREITYWYEIHTVHKSKDECEEEVRKHIQFHDFLWREVLCIPPIKVRRPPFDVFPGAEYSVEHFTILPDGRLLENGSVNNLGQAYARKFNLEYIDEKGTKNYCWQVCTGNGARYLVAAFLVHGDERGLVLPPKIAPFQVIIIPIYKKSNKDEIVDKARKVNHFLSNNGIRSSIDERDEITVGEKFYLSEIKGIPLRIELGSRELKSDNLTVFRRDTKTKIEVNTSEILAAISSLLNKNVPVSMYQKAENFYRLKTKYFDEIEEVLRWIKNSNVAKVSWCGDKKCHEGLSSLEQGIESIGTLEDEHLSSRCIMCGKKTENLTLIGRTY
jgi:prolyl-tRNA synthetase